MKKPAFMEPLWKAHLRYPFSFAGGVLGFSVCAISNEWLAAGAWVLVLIWMDVASINRFRAEMAHDFIALCEADRQP